ncbi:pickpocket protein 19-like [Eurosta solidaginis]|uniref:pickpocket protein 19-like n=1 Tax=Eurosta solidaginis TaxID=178769 RepID=UPI003530FA0F
MVQIYYNELIYAKSPKKPANRLLLSNERMPKTTLKKRNLCHDILSYTKGYCDISCLHGISYVTNPKLRYYERVIWFLIIIVTTCTGLYIYSELTELYHTQRLVTVVDDSLAPAYIVPFPAIVICPRNRINWSKILDAHQWFLPSNASAMTIDTFRKFFANLGNFRFGKFTTLQPLIEADLNLTLLDNVDVKGVLEYASFTCDELFQYPCSWHLKSYNCCELFSLERTESGFCFIFNSLVTEKDRERKRNDRYYPYHTADIVEGSGLLFTVRLNESKATANFTEINGVYVMVKQPELWNGVARFVPYNTYSKLPVVPQLTLTANRARTVSPMERRCLFEDETWHELYKKLPGVEYRRSNCYSRCRQEYLFNNCHCNLDMFFPQVESDNMTVCKAKDFKCLYKFRELFGNEYRIANKEDQYIETTTNINESMICNCLSSCNHLIYDTAYISEALQDVNYSDPLKLVRLDVHYTSQYIRAYSTITRFTFVELLANFGGIFGLFLGGSLMSLVELVYYFTIGLYTYLLERGYTFNGWFSLPKSNAKVGIWKKRNKKERKLFERKPNNHHVYM